MRRSSFPIGVVTVWLLCGIGLFASARMLAKLRRAERGELGEPSVVTAPAARLYGLPNAALGLAYYPAIALGAPFLQIATVRIAVLGAAAVAALTSLVLGYDLLARTRRPCPLCWSAHAVNLALAVLLSVFASLSQEV